jgi:hypothetical protein
MELIADAFLNREWSAAELTEAMNIIPNNYGLVTQLGIFPEPVALGTTYVSIERQNWSLNLLPMTTRGAPGTRGSVGKRDRITFEIPQVTHEDAVTVADIQNLAYFNRMMPKMVEDKVNEKLVTMAMKHQITHEWYRVNALQGKILDADGTVVVNYFTAFGITQKVAAFDFAGSPNVARKLRAIKRAFENDARGETMTGVACIASPEFMESMFADTEVKKVHDAAMSAHMLMVAMNPTLKDRRFSFTYQDVTFIEYSGSANAVDATGTYTNRRFVPAGEAIFFPLGTTESARQYVAPGDFLEAANLPGRLYYAKQEPMKHGRGLEFLTQSNLLVMWRRPDLLCRGVSGNSGDTVG